MTGRPALSPNVTSQASGTGSPPWSDARAVQLLLGRDSITDYRVAVRCPHGGPAVLENDPRDRDGRPFPTRNWLACRHLSGAVSRLEARGGVSELERDPALADALTAAHRRHAELHAGHRVTGSSDAGRVKCLHAHLAFGLACGGTPVSDWILDRASAGWPERCCVEDLDVSEGRG